MSENDKLKLELKAFYLAGGSRKEAMERWKLTTGQLAGLSTRLEMHNWKWPTENRRSGIAPSGVIPRAPSAQRATPRKQGEGSGGIIHSIQARQERRAGPDVEVAPDAPLYLDQSMIRRRYRPSTLLSEREKRERGYSDSDTEFGGRLSPFPTPREVSGKKDDLTRAEIHAIAALYRN